MFLTARLSDSLDSELGLGRMAKGLCSTVANADSADQGLLWSYDKLLMNLQVNPKNLNPISPKHS